MILHHKLDYSVDYNHLQAITADNYSSTNSNYCNLGTQRCSMLDSNSHAESIAESVANLHNFDRLASLACLLNYILNYSDSY